MNIKHHIFNFRYRHVTGNVKKTAKLRHYHYQINSLPIGSQTGSWTCVHISVQIELYLLSFFCCYRITTLRKNDHFGFLEEKMVLMVFVFPFRGWIPGKIWCFQNNLRCLFNAQTGFISVNSSPKKSYSW